MTRLSVLAAALLLAACATDSDKRNVQSVESQKWGAGVKTYSVDSVADEIRRMPPQNHPNNTMAIPPRGR